MRWFDGSIAEAVAQSKAKNAVFIVFIEGTDESSQQLAATLEEPGVSKLLSDTERFLSIKLSSTSSNYMHFASEMYKLRQSGRNRLRDARQFCQSAPSVYTDQFVPVPSVFFIGRDGAPLEVVCDGVTADNLTDRIKVILAHHHKSVTDLASGSTSAPSTASSSQAFIQHESKPQNHAATPQPTANVSDSKMDVPPAEVSKPAPVSQPDADTQTPKDEAPKQARTEDVEYEVVCDGDVCVRRPKAASSPPPPSEGPSTEQMVMEAAPPEAPATDVRVDRAKELIEQKRREKEAKEKELEKQKELERRATGQGVAELKRWQADQELKQLAEERKREKAANDQVRQRILEQIAQDRAERRAREFVPAASSATPPPAESTSVGDGSHARLQFKLVDGSSHVAQFQADDTIATVHRYITDNIQPSQGSFTLWTAFPRRNLPAGPETLRELLLLPSAALLVLPASGAGPASAPSGIGPAAVPHTITQIYTMITSLLLTYLIEPTQAAWAWISERLFPAPPRTPSPNPTAASDRASAAPGLRYRPSTNVHRLTEDRSSDDENSTWNGNSTQQM